MFTTLGRHTRKLLLLASVLIGSALLARNAAAQLDPDVRVLFEVIQDGRPQALIFVDGGQDPCRYVENWFLFEDYVYPNARNGASFTVRPTGETEWSREEFLRQMWAAHPGGTHIDVFAAERRAGCQ